MPDFMKAEFAVYEQEQEQKAFMAKMQRDVPAEVLTPEPSEDAPLPATAKELERKLKDVEAVMKYIHAGRATFTLRSKKTGTRFTYRVIKPKEKDHDKRFGPYDDNKWLVKVLYGPDNNTMYRFFGFIRRHVEESVAYPGCKVTSWRFEYSNNYKFQEVVKS